MSRAKRQRQKENTRLAREAREAAMKRDRRKKTVIRVGAAAVVVVAVGVVWALLTGDDGDDVAATDTSSTTVPAETTTTVPFVVATALPEGCVDTVPEQPAERPTFTDAPAMEIDPAKSYTATVSTTCGDIAIALDAANAPTSVNNFVHLARAGFYDGLKFNRSVVGFVVQTGSPDNTQLGGPGYSVTAELPPAGVYTPGAVAWAKANEEAAGTAGSQFFIVSGSPDQLTPDYGWLGTVTSGLENAQKIESLAPETRDGPPVFDVYINSITITEGDATPPTEPAASDATVASDPTTVAP